MYDSPNVKVCDWCDHKLTYNPFTRTDNGKLYLLCSNACFNDHWQYSRDKARREPRFNFDVVI